MRVTSSHHLSALLAVAKHAHTDTQLTAKAILHKRGRLAVKMVADGCGCLHHINWKAIVGQSVGAAAAASTPFTLHDVGHALAWPRCGC